VSCSGATKASARLVAITRDDLEHRYVLNRLCERFPIAGIVVDTREKSGGLGRALRHGVGSFLSRAALKVYWRLMGDRRARERALQSVLGADRVDAWHVGAVPMIRVDGINSAQGIEAVRSLSPDVLLVYGTSIIRAPVLESAQGIALNMHTGISPHYRGTHCAFWPIANGEWNMLGATVHECTAEIDGGRIFETAVARPQPGDSIHDCFARAVIAGTDAYCRVVEQYLAGTLEGEKQDLSLGREYRGHMRGLAAELRARRALRRLAARAGNAE
jgi:hypothetical protein